MNPRERRMLILGALLLLCVQGFIVILARTAWMCDDAYITLRTVDNFVHGYGLRWNVAERVQAYTHPLWMFLLSAVYYFTGEGFLTPIAVSMAVTMLALLLLVFGVARTPGNAVVGLTALLFSRAFMDYSTSGLENPLTHLLLVLFVLFYLRRQWTSRLLALLTLIASLIALNRLDAILFVAPAVVYVWGSLRTRHALAALAMGAFPLGCWLLFSLAYYGFLFPNTAYAKLGTGISGIELAQQGLWYYVHTLTRDPSTLPVIALALVWGLRSRKPHLMMLVLGVLLYLGYIVRIGGDFMGGRFFTAPLFMAALLLILLPQRGVGFLWPPACLAIVLLSNIAPYMPTETGATFGEYAAGFKDAHGIGDERRFYYQHTGLLRWEPGKEMPTHGYAKTGREYRAADEYMIKSHGSVGFRGFFGGPKVHIIDWYALADPLLARLPAEYNPEWRIGHFARSTPKGYPESAGGQENRIEDAELALYYDHLRRITRAPVFSPTRWHSILLMNLGRLEYLIDKDRYRFPHLAQASLSQLAERKEPGASAGRSGTRMSNRGMHIDIESRSQATRMEFSAVGAQALEILFLCEGVIVDKASVISENPAPLGYGVYDMDVPKRAVQQGYDAIRIMPYGDGKGCTLGHLVLLP